MEVPQTHQLINPYSWAQLAVTVLWLGEANYLYQWQIGSIKNDKENFPDRLHYASESY